MVWPFQAAVRTVPPVAMLSINSISVVDQLDQPGSAQ
jgi:hypothetical protein